MREDDPRAQRSRAALLAAAGRVLAERGPAGVTVDAVATEAGVARTTVYRHYPDLGDLVGDAVAHAAPHGPEIDTGSVAEDVIQLMLGLARGLGQGAWAELLPALLLAAPKEPRTARVLADFVEERRRHLLRAIERGRARGEISADAEADHICDLVAGAVYYRVLVRRTPVPEPVLRDLVETVLAPVRP